MTAEVFAAARARSSSRFTCAPRRYPGSRCLLQGASTGQSEGQSGPLSGGLGRSRAVPGGPGHPWKRDERRPDAVLCKKALRRLSCRAPPGAPHAGAALPDRGRAAGLRLTPERTQEGYAQPVRIPALEHRALAERFPDRGFVVAARDPRGLAVV